MPEQMKKRPCCTGLLAHCVRRQRQTTQNIPKKVYPRPKKVGDFWYYGPFAETTLMQVISALCMIHAMEPG